MEVYETEEYSIISIRKFAKWLDAEIGTEYEQNDSGGALDEYYLMIFDLTMKEVEKIRDYENNFD